MTVKENVKIASEILLNDYSRGTNLIMIQHASICRQEEITVRIVYIVNTMRPRQNGRHFPDDIINAFS